MIAPSSYKKVSFWKEILPILLLVGILFFLPVQLSLLIAGIILFFTLAFVILFYPTTLWWTIIALVPFSIDLGIYFNHSIGMYFPTEPILFLFLLLGLLYFIQHPIKKDFLYHPISILLGLYLCWMAVTVVTSSNILISAKRLLSYLWFIVPIFLLGSILLQKKESQKKFFSLYLFGFSIVIIYTFIQLILHDFPEKTYDMMRPFFKDHTILGAGLGLTIPYVFLKSFQQKIAFNKRALWLSLAILYTIVLIFTYSRAALLSVIVSLLLYCCIALRLKFKHLLLSFVLIVVGVLLFQGALIKTLSHNKVDSSGKIWQNIESISNVSTDASNLERINRWEAAIDMAKERPIFGWGPGTYQFEYAPFQNSENLTIISTNFGDVGNAHSEYLGPLAESGWPGAILFTLFVIVTIGIGYSTVLQLERKDRLIPLAALLGLAAYFTHGLLNDFLDSDKVAVLIWGYAAIIVHYHLKVRRKKTFI